jgi:hypothetical protein
MKQIAVVIISLILAGSSWAQGAEQSKGPKWFVLRHSQTGFCRPRLLIRIQGHYRHGWGQVAAGPYDTQDGAQKRIKALIGQNICTNE